ncbi:hypothetical protein [Pseudarthrobacter sp. Y6]|uniref:hypothetical protein n=1 Tax=Pseudarthrobacter sp. Y6 TaxID=3418422 RepID=UPI003CE77DF3
MAPLPGDMFKGDDYLVRKVRDLERFVQQLAAANQLGAAGIRAVDGGITVEGSQTVNGPLTINGAAVITGTLDLPAGIIGNDALSSPVTIGTASDGIGNYAINTASTVRKSITLTCPAGFTQAVVTANPTAMGYNSTATADYLYVQSVIQGVGSGELYTSAPAGVGVGLAAPFHLSLTGLTDGETITVAVATRAGNGTWAASTGNQANIYATAIFLR